MIASVRVTKIYVSLWDTSLGCLKGIHGGDEPIGVWTNLQLNLTNKTS